MGKEQVVFCGTCISKYSDTNHKHVFPYCNLALYSYIIFMGITYLSEKFDFMLEINILRNSAQKKLVSYILRVGVSKCAQRPCCVRL